MLRVCSLLRFFFLLLLERRKSECVGIAAGFA